MIVPEEQAYQMLNEITLVIESFVLPQGGFRSFSVYNPLRTN